MEDATLSRYYGEFVKAFVEEMWITASSRAGGQLQDEISKPEAFKKKALELCKSQPYQEYLWEKFSSYSPTYGITPEMREILNRVQAKIAMLGVRPQPEEAIEIIHQEIMQNEKLRQAWDEMPSLFSRRSILIGEEVEAVQCYIAYGLPTDLFYASSYEAQKERDEEFNKAETKAYYENARKIYHELYYSQPPEAQSKIREKYLESVNDWGGDEDLGTVQALEYFLEKDAPTMLGKFESADDIKERWKAQKGTRKSIQEKLYNIAFYGKDLTYLPEKVRQEITNTPERRLIFTMLHPFSCFIGSSTEHLVNIWPLVSPKSVDLYHASLKKAFEICKDARRKMQSRHPASTMLAEQSSSMQQAKHALEMLFEALEARQLEREMAEKRNLELSDTIETELSDTEWMERLGDRVIPRPWQLVSTEVAANNPRVFLADPTGFGKTGQALLVLERNLAYPAIIICPPSVFMNWAAAARQWLPHRTVSLIENRPPEKISGELVPIEEIWKAYDQELSYSSARRKKVQPPFAEVSIEVYQKGSGSRQFTKELVPIDRLDADIVIVSKDAVKNDVSKGKNGTIIPRLLERVNEGFVFDESHYLKNRNTQTYRAAWVLSMQSKTRLLLSATLLTNNAEELRNQLAILGQLYDFFGSPEEFNEAFNSLKGGGLRGGTEGNPEQQMLKTEKVNEILRRCCYVRRFPEQLESIGAMPTPQRETIPIFLNEHWAKIYHESIVGFQQAIRVYASDIARMLYKYLVEGAKKLFDVVSSFNFLEAAKAYFIELLETYANKKKTPSRFKDLTEREIHYLLAEDALKSGLSRAIQHITFEIIQKIEKESEGAIQILDRMLNEINRQFKQSVFGDYSSEEEEEKEIEESFEESAAEDEEEDEETASARKKHKAKKKDKRELSESQVKLFTAAIELFFEMSIKRELRDVNGNYDETLAADGEGFGGYQEFLVDAYAKVIAKSRLEGAALSRVGKLSQITSAAKSKFATSLLMQMLQTNTYAPLPYRTEAEKQQAVEKSIYPLVEIDGHLHEQRPTKVVFFTQYKTTLDYVAKVLEDNGVSFVQISGKEDKKQKAASQIAFASSPNVRVCICTIGAAREGLNLQVADQAIFCDAAFTAAATEQAEGRIKRLGSPFRKVYLTYLVVPDSIDTLTVALMERKRSIMLGVQEGASSLKRRFIPLGEDRFSLEYETEVAGGRVSTMMLGLGGPADIYGLNEVPDEDDPDWEPKELDEHLIQMIEDGWEALYSSEATGPSPVVDVLKDWKAAADHLSEERKAMIEMLRRSEKVGDEKESEAATDALAMYDAEDTKLANSVLSFLESEPTMTLTEKQTLAIRQATTDIQKAAALVTTNASIKNIADSATLQSFDFEGK